MKKQVNTIKKSSKSSKRNNSGKGKGKGQQAEPKSKVIAGVNATWIDRGVYIPSDTLNLVLATCKQLDSAQDEIELAKEQVEEARKQAETIKASFTKLVKHAVKFCNKDKRKANAACRFIILQAVKAGYKKSTISPIISNAKPEWAKNATVPKHKPNQDAIDMAKKVLAKFRGSEKKDKAIAALRKQLNIIQAAIRLVKMDTI